MAALHLLSGGAALGLSLTIPFFDRNRTEVAIAQAYLADLDDLPGLSLPRAVSGHAWNYFVVRHPQRDRLQARYLR